MVLSRICFSVSGVNSPRRYGLPCHGEKPVIAVEILILPVPGLLFQKPVVAADGYAVLHRGKTARYPDRRSGEGTSGRVPVPHLQRVQIETVSPVHIQQQLGGIPDSRHRVKGVASPQQGEIGPPYPAGTDRDRSPGRNFPSSGPCTRPTAGRKDCRKCKRRPCLPG